MQTRTLVASTVAAALFASFVVACSASTVRDGFKEGEQPAGENPATNDGDQDPDNGQSIAGDDGGAPPANTVGAIDLDAVEPCDQDLPVDGDVEQFLKAIGLCKMTDEDSGEWGVISAKFTKGVNTTSNARNDQHGILPKFGDVLTPREGASLGMLSTGFAREFDTNGSSQVAFTPGKSWDSVSILDPSEQNDVIALRLRIRVPTNAKSLMFDFNFHSSEWPNYINSGFNDEFRANLNGENISFDANQNPVSVNLGFFDRCKPNETVGCSGNQQSTSECFGGDAELEGTGFGLRGSGCRSSDVPKGGATGWLTTQSPVEAGSIIELDFVIWDARDASWDSAVLIDNFRWDADAVTVGTGRPPA